MRNEEVVRKNISLVFDFLRYLTENPELMEKMPDQCELEFLEKDVQLVRGFLEITDIIGNFINLVDIHSPFNTPVDGIFFIKGEIVTGLVS